MFLKRRVFKFFIKVVVSVRQRISTGREFHSLGATAPRDRSPYCPFVRSMVRSQGAAVDRNLRAGLRSLRNSCK
jgi:hypothetical protein